MYKKSHYFTQHIYLFGSTIFFRMDCIGNRMYWKLLYFAVCFCFVVIVGGQVAFVCDVWNWFCLNQFPHQSCYDSNLIDIDDVHVINLILMEAPLYAGSIKFSLFANWIDWLIFDLKNCLAQRFTHLSQSFVFPFEKFFLRNVYTLISFD